MNIDIICPLYEAEEYLVSLHEAFLMQKNVDIRNIRYILTESKDGTGDILKTLDKCIYRCIEKKDFSHFLTREEEAFSSDADIIVFVSQDVKIKRDDWLYELVRPIIEGECDASFSRQICDDDSIEKYTREKNYPERSRLVSKDDIPSLGLYAFFFSNASGAILRETFVKLGGYDHKNFGMNEDMYCAYKLITNGYKVKYCADSEVIHYHQKSLKDIYKRYYETGRFFKENPYLEKYSIGRSGESMAGYILKRAIGDGNIKVILEWLPNMTARYLGLKAGRR